MEHSMGHWANDAVFYHVYPLGLCDAPPRNDFDSPVVPRLAQLVDWIDHLKDLHVNALYLGLVFESTAHGYDTADYFRVDRRLGHNETLARVVSALHREGIRVILDGVFNHVGRDFWAFRDVQAHQRRSAYKDWFAGLSFDGRSPHDDPFTYEGWKGFVLPLGISILATFLAMVVGDTGLASVYPWSLPAFTAEALGKGVLPWGTVAWGSLGGIVAAAVGCACTVRRDVL